MSSDPFSAFKDRQREMWSSFAPTEVFTTPTAANLVRYAGIAQGEEVLDIGTGTGVVAITAARAGARARGIDLTPPLLEHARENARIARLDVEFLEGDVEQLPYPDTTFDVVVSQFGHMFAPRPERAVAEMRRVLKPSGRIAFATWPPDRLVGQVFAIVGRNSPAPPPGAAPPALWGDEAVITERLSNDFEKLEFERGVMPVSALSPGHYRLFMELCIGPIRKLVESLADAPPQLDAIRRELETISEPYFAGNAVEQEYVMTRAAAR